MSIIRRSPLSFIEPLEARIAPAAGVDLVLQFVSIHFPDVAVPGDEGTMTFTIKNIGDTAATHKTCINFWLVPDPGVGAAPGDAVFYANGFNSSKSEKIVDGLKDVAVNLKPGDTSAPITRGFSLPEMVLGGGLVAPTDIYSSGAGVTPFNMTPGPHFIVAEVDGASENDVPIWFLYHQNNFAAAPAPFDYEYKFGDISPGGGVVGQPRTGVKLSAINDPGNRSSFQLDGGGTGEFHLQTNITDLDVKGASTASSLSVKLPKTQFGGDLVKLRDITANAGLKEIRLPRTEVSGNVNIAGPLGALTLGSTGNLAAGATAKAITLGGLFGTDKPVKITLDVVFDRNIVAPAGIDTLEVRDWTDTDSGVHPDLITTPFINSLSSDGDFGAGLVLSEGGKGGNALGKATIAGGLSGAWTVAGAAHTVGKIVAAHADMSTGEEWTLTSDGAVDSILIFGLLKGPGGLVPTLKAPSFESIAVADLSEVNIATTGADGDGYSIETLIANSVANVAIGGLSGGIRKIAVGEWSGGSVSAAFLNTLTVDGDGTPTGNFGGALFLGGRPQGSKDPTLGKVVIAGNLTNSLIGFDDWEIDGPISSITVGGDIASGWNLDGVPGSGKTHDIGKLVVKGAFAGKVAANQIDGLSVTGDFSGDLELNRTKVSGKLTFAKIIGGTVRCADYLNTLSATRIQDSTIEAGSIFEIFTTGSTKLGVTGDIENSTIQATHGIGIVKASGSLKKLTLKAENGLIANVSADEWIEGSMTAQQFDRLALGGDAKANKNGNLANVTMDITGTSSAQFTSKFFVLGVVDHSKITTAEGKSMFQLGGMLNSSAIKVTNAAGLIDKFEIRGGKGLPAILFDASTVSAPVIKSVILRDVNTAGGGTPFGITADKIITYSRKAAGTEVADGKNLDAMQTLDPQGNFSVMIT